MAINSNLFQRPTDRGLFLAAAVLFPLIVLFGYFKSYYFSAFFDARPIANALVHAHGVVMTLWVVFFTMQIALARSKNIKLHRRMGMVGVGLAVLVIVVGMATAYDSLLVRGSAPPGLNPHGFFFIPVLGMSLFVIYFAGAIYYRKRPAEHKSLMLLTAINFLPPALARISLFPPEYMVIWTYVVPELIAIIAFAWYTWKHRKLNKVFAAGVLLFIVAFPLQVFVPGTETWLRIAGWLAP